MKHDEIVTDIIEKIKANHDQEALEILHHHEYDIGRKHGEADLIVLYRDHVDSYEVKTGRRHTEKANFQLRRAKRYINIEFHEYNVHSFLVFRPVGTKKYTINELKI